MPTSRASSPPAIAKASNSGWRSDKKFLNQDLKNHDVEWLVNDNIAKGEIKIKVKIIGNEIKITITDFGIGIADISQAKQPFFTSKPEQERSGMGFTVMESFMDSMEVQNNTTRGVTVHLTKSIRNTKSQVVGG